MHVSRWTVAVVARVDQEHIPSYSSEATEGSKTCRAASDDDGIVLRRLVPRNSGSAHKGG